MELLKKLIQAESPSGFEANAQKVWSDEAGKYADEVMFDVHGNSTAVANKKGNKKVMFSAHIDEVGYMVRHINDDGYIFFVIIGGVDNHLLPGQMVTILTKGGGKKTGVVGRLAVHCIEEDEGKKTTKVEECWIDIGAVDKDDVEKCISIGDPIVPSNTFSYLSGSRITGRGLDDKVGVWIMAKLLYELTQCGFGGAKEDPSVYCSATVQEEIGCRGAITSTYAINPAVAIALDVTFAVDHPEIDKEKFGDVELGGGPVISRGPNINNALFDELVKSAENAGVDYQVEAEPGATGTDARAMQVTRGGIATGLISIPLRYMHSPVEVVDTNDLEDTVKLLTQFCLRMGKNIDFVPKPRGDNNAL